MLKKIIDKIKDKRFASSQSYLLTEEGSLLNAFYNSKTIFIHIPKTAGISVINSVYGDVIGGGHRKFIFYKYLFGDQIKDFYVFTIVRNPYNRLYSAYKFLQKGGINRHDKYAYDKYIAQYKNFEDFVNNGLTAKLLKEIIHFVPQTDFIYDQSDNLLVDNVYKFENLKVDFKHLSEKLKINIALPHLNKNQYDQKQRKYTSSMIEKVHHFYNKDFNLLGY